MKKYRQLTVEDRIYIEVWHFENKSLRYMASRLGFHASTISREIRRGKLHSTASGYRADLGEKLRRETNAKRGRKHKITSELAERIVMLIRRDWSPEAIAARLKLELEIQICHETIYKFIARDRRSGGLLYLHLRRGRRRRRKRFHVPRVRTDILLRKHISERPRIVDERNRFGDWERDLMFGESRSEALLTIVERKTQLTLIRRVRSKSPKEIAAQTIAALKDRTCLSLTNDNGFEFRNHVAESATLRAPIYFTNPYSSWEKGTCENINGLIRQYVSRTTKLSELSDEKIKEIENKINSRPRKKLGFQTPLEASTGGTIRKLCQLKDDF